VSNKILQTLLVTLAVMNVADYLLTLRAISFGAVEANPVMAAAMDAGMFGPVKLLAVPLICLGIWCVRDRVRLAVRGMVAGAVAVYAGLMVWHFQICAFFVR
jgi:hypothetical protein